MLSHPLVRFYLLFSILWVSGYDIGRSMIRLSQSEEVCDTEVVKEGREVVLFLSVKVSLFCFLNKPRTLLLAEPRLRTVLDRWIDRDAAGGESGPPSYSFCMVPDKVISSGGLSLCL
ncbi:hypothetical protein BC941DRAFT_92084 [Chlamydoabsidia padenii]|nr:hypothetical protein BC941DRAFT_92084 [Chlamydoabsidia padenii]